MSRPRRPGRHHQPQGPARLLRARRATSAASMLKGPEVKSIRNGRANLQDALRPRRRRRGLAVRHARLAVRVLPGRARPGPQAQAAPPRTARSPRSPGRPRRRASRSCRCASTSRTAAARSRSRPPGARRATTSARRSPTRDAKRDTERDAEGDAAAVSRPSRRARVPARGQRSARSHGLDALDVDPRQPFERTSGTTSCGRRAAPSSPARARAARRSRR